MNSECSYQNVQLRRLICAHCTRNFVTHSGHRRYIRLADQTTDVKSQSVQADLSLRTSFIVGFTMQRLMRDLFVQTLTLSTLGTIFSR